MERPECYPGTQVQINLLDLRDSAKLEIAEAVFTTKRDQQFYADPDRVVVVPQAERFSLKHLCAIHHYQFQDVYSWAGIPRAFRMRKNHLREFSLPEYIEPFGQSIYENINSDKILFEGDIREASKRLAHYMALVNILHPFPEGNGRSQRAFIWLLAKDAGYNLNWQLIPKSMIHAAAIRLMKDSDKEGIEHLVDCIIESA